MYEHNPRGYMSNSFDKQPPDDTSFIQPDKWREHFKNLLGPVISLSQQELDMEEYVKENCDNFKTEFQQPISKTELIKCIGLLKNIKASSFDQVTNEMLKSSKLIITDQLLFLFNTIIDATVYPSVWRKDILSPLHKSGDKNDPGIYANVMILFRDQNYFLNS